MFLTCLKKKYIYLYIFSITFYKYEYIKTTSMKNDIGPFVIYFYNAYNFYNIFRQYFKIVEFS